MALGAPLSVRAGRRRIALVRLLRKPSSGQRTAQSRSRMLSELLLAAELGLWAKAFVLSSLLFPRVRCCFLMAVCCRD